MNSGESSQVNKSPSADLEDHSLLNVADSEDSWADSEDSCADPSFRPKFLAIPQMSDYHTVPVKRQYLWSGNISWLEFTVAFMQLCQRHNLSYACQNDLTKLLTLSHPPPSCLPKLHLCTYETLCWSQRRMKNAQSIATVHHAWSAYKVTRPVRIQHVQEDVHLSKLRCKYCSDASIFNYMICACI